ncbi:MAG: GNAT family N-acetyltransferase [Tepidisphaeraceae bacterium]
MSIEQELLIRRATLKDAVTLAAYNIHMALETERKRLDPYVVSAGVRNALEDPRKGLYLVADLNGRVIGQLLITREWSDWRNGDIWWIQSVYVNPEFRKQGVFTRLHQQAEHEARECGAVAMRLYVEQENTAALATYASLGLKPTRYTLLEKSLHPKDSDEAVVGTAQ